MKKILIICDLFPPAFGPRMGYLCKYLKQEKWEPVVLTEASQDTTFSFLANKCPTIYVRFYSGNKWLRRLQWVWVMLADFLFHHKDKRMYDKAKELCDNTTFDLILCSTYKTFPLRAALKIAQTYKLPLITDLRDIIEQYSGHEFLAHSIPIRGIAELYKRNSLRERNQVLKQADYVTTVSPWHRKMLQEYNPKVRLIYNGYDPELFYADKKRTDKFIISYTGRLLSTSMRNPSLLFEAINKLTKSGQFSPESCRIQWYTDKVSQKIIERDAEKAGLTAYMDYKKYVPATQIPQILNNSSIMLLLTNKADNDGPKGIMTTKFFEAIGTRTPILCVRSDEDCLEKAIQSTKSGLAARNVEQVSSFLLQTYQNWKADGFTISSTNMEAADKYSRKRQADQFMRIFTRLTS